jgi:hypothetical protein
MKFGIPLCFAKSKAGETMTGGLWQSDNSMTPERLSVVLLAALFLAFLTYYPALSSGFIWDDDLYIEANESLRSLNGLKDIWLKPLTTPQWYPQHLPPSGPNTNCGDWRHSDIT